MQTIAQPRADRVHEGADARGLGVLLPADSCRSCSGASTSASAPRLGLVVPAVGLRQRPAQGRRSPGPRPCDLDPSGRHCQRDRAPGVAVRPRPGHRDVLGHAGAADRQAVGARPRAGGAAG
ncbi:MAG: hypothetical protein MZV63_46630 [Marinilabiliales bacterium]|nr:hypothetical protein [Marinilabiliales bacterium]